MAIDAGAFDQSSSFIADSFPPMWKRMYDGLISAGFNEEQAMMLLRTYIHATVGGRMEK